MIQEKVELSDGAREVLKALIDLELEENAVVPAETIETIGTWSSTERRAFLDELIDRLDPKTGDTKRKYLDVLRAFADDVMAIRLADLLVDAEVPHESARPLAELVRGVATRGAFMELQRLAFTASAPSVVMEARHALMREADERGVRMWKIEDDLVPSCGLDVEGGTVFSTDDRSLEFRLGADLEPVLLDTQSKERFDELPGGQPSELERWHILKNHVEDVVPVQVKRLEQALALQYRWESQHWKEHVYGHPMMRYLVQRALWARYKSSGKFLESFRVDEDGEMCDCNDDPFRLSGEGFVGLLHPIDLYPEIAELWGAQFADYEIVTLFPQIDRPIFNVDPETKKDLEIQIDWSGPTEVGQGCLFRRGWVLDDQGWNHAFKKTYRFHDILVSLRFTENNGKLEIHNGSFRRFLGYPDHSFQLRDVPPVVFSEVRYDIELLKSAGS